MTQTLEATFEEVIRAGRVLFGPGFLAEAAGWRDVLRSTYRRRAMETHPDRARALGRRESDLAREFEAVASAYHTLSSLRTGSLPRAAAAPRSASGPTPPPRARRAAPQPAAPRARGAEPGPRRSGGPRVRVGVRPEDLPRRRLRFAEYLYYSGRAGWSDLVEAIAWQRSQRPRIGRIAVSLGFLRPDDVAAIMERRRREDAQGLLFGEWAVRNGYLSQFQLLAALGRQKRMSRPIGEWFVARGLIDPEDIDPIRDHLMRHNVRHGWFSATRPAR